MVILDRNCRILFLTSGAETLFYFLDGTGEDWRKRLKRRQEVPAAIHQLVRVLIATARGERTRTPRSVAVTPWGVMIAEASWLAQPCDPPESVAADPESVPIVVHLELRENATAYAARVLRKHGASPAQVHVGALLAIGRSKPEIARRLGVRPSSVADATRKLYQRIDVRNATELGTKLWLADLEAG